MYGNGREKVNGDNIDDEADDNDGQQKPIVPDDRMNKVEKNCSEASMRKCHKNQKRFNWKNHTNNAENTDESIQP